MNRILKILMIPMVLSVSTVAHGTGHEYVNYMRSSTTSYVLFQQSVVGDYGRYTVHGKNDAGESFTQNQFWKGYGIDTSFGLEIMKFIQFVAGHTLVNQKYKDDALERMTGSRLHGGVRLVFSAPLANLELGLGARAARLDYQKQLENAEFYGSGSYYSLGLNYFLTSRFSIYGEGSTTKDHLVRGGGSAGVSSMDTTSNELGFGFRIWL